MQELHTRADLLTSLCPWYTKLVLFVTAEVRLNSWDRSKSSIFSRASRVRSRYPKSSLMPGRAASGSSPMEDISSCSPIWSTSTWYAPAAGWGGWLPADGNPSLQSWPAVCPGEYGALGKNRPELLKKLSMYFYKEKIHNLHRRNIIVSWIFGHKPPLLGYRAYRRKTQSQFSLPLSPTQIHTLLKVLFLKHMRNSTFSSLLMIYHSHRHQKMI